MNQSFWILKSIMIFRAGDIFNGHNLVYSGYGFTKLPGMMHRVMLLTGSDSQYEV